MLIYLLLIIINITKPRFARPTSYVFTTMLIKDTPHSDTHKLNKLVFNVTNTNKFGVLREMKWRFYFERLSHKLSFGPIENFWKYVVATRIIQPEPRNSNYEARDRWNAMWKAAKLKNKLYKSVQLVEFLSISFVEAFSMFPVSTWRTQVAFFCYFQSFRF